MINCSINQHFRAYKDRNWQSLNPFYLKRSQYVVWTVHNVQSYKDQNLAQFCTPITLMKFTITHSNVTRIFYYALTNTQILIVNDIKYTTVNYVDDSTNTIPYKTSPELHTSQPLLQASNKLLQH